MKKQTLIGPPRDNLRRAKRKAVAKGSTPASAVEEAPFRPKQENAASTGQRTVSVRVSKATGGMRPGMESLTFSELEELDDLEYVERLKAGFE